MDRKPKRGRGRPPKEEKDKKKTVTVSLRVDERLLASLTEDALRQGKSVNKEIVDRLERTVSQGGYIDNWVFGSAQNHNLMRLIGMMVRNIHQSEGAELWSNPAAHQDLKDAIEVVMDAFGPKGGIPAPHLDETTGQRWGRSWLGQFRNSRTKAIRLPGERKTTDGEFIDLTTDEYIIPDIWKGLGNLADKLETTNE